MSGKNSTQIKTPFAEITIAIEMVPILQAQEVLGPTQEHSIGSQIDRKLAVCELLRNFEGIPYQDL
jgi:hypothetical protein